MIIKLDDIANIELKNFLLRIKGITDVKINDNDHFIKLNIRLTKKTNT